MWAGGGSYGFVPDVGDLPDLWGRYLLFRYVRFVCFGGGGWVVGGFPHMGHCGHRGALWTYGTWPLLVSVLSVVLVVSGLSGLSAYLVNGGISDIGDLSLMVGHFGRYLIVMIFVRYVRFLI